MIRPWVKLLSAIVYTLTIYVIYMPGYLLTYPFKTFHSAWRNLYMRVWSHGMCLFLNIHVKTEGVPPKPPFFIVSNHLSYIDIISLYLNLKCTFVAKKEVRSWPVLGFMVMTMGVVFIDRSRKKDVVRVNQILSESLHKRQGIAVFPEGTTSGGEGILPFRPPLLQYPADMNLPVYYSSLRYETNEAKGDLHARESVCFFGAREPFHKHLFKLASNKRINCTVRFCEKPIKDGDRKQLAEKLREGVVSIFDPMV